MEEQEKQLTARDKNDSERKESPLTQVGDAMVVDTTSLTIEEQVEKIIELAQEAFTRK
jgi:cytidylate kinase